MLLKRVLTALAGIPVMVYIFYKGGIFLLCAVLVLIILGMAEFNNIAGKAGYRNLTLPIWLAGLILPFVYQYNNDMIAVAIFLLLSLTILSYLLRFPRLSPVDLAFSLLGFIYVVMGFIHILMLRGLTNGFWLLIYVFIVVWSSDTAAYFVGTHLGKHRLASKISPHKTWEGLVGGLVFSSIAAYILIITANLTDRMFLFWFAPAVSLAGQMGDLFESTLKRYANIKDSGNIIPGHGGVLDRFDSTLWAVPLTYYLVVYGGRLF